MKAIYELSNNQFLSCIESVVDQSLISTSQYEIKDLLQADEELVLQNQIRPLRDELLKLSDELWVEKSSKGQDLTTINDYKQALRDFPITINFSALEYIDQLVWPVMVG